MHGTLKVTRQAPHFLFFLLTITLEEGIDNMVLHTTAGVTIRQMRRDEQNGVYILDYYIPLHLARKDSVYLIDDMVSIERWKNGEKAEVLANIRLSFTRELQFLCSLGKNFIVEETGSFEFKKDTE